MTRNAFLLFCLWLPALGHAQPGALYATDCDHVVLTQAGASHLASLPLKCMQQPYPYKTGVIYTDATSVQEPQAYHPAFYGCFDWHSSVHGHWMLVRLLKLFPDMPEAATIREKLAQNLSAANIQQEMLNFDGMNQGFQRTYGWGWLLQLQAELLDWDDSLGRRLAANLTPLADKIADAYVSYLPKMNYPIRVGEHSNLAFGLRLAYDYADAVGHDSLRQCVAETALRFYRDDAGCPLGWEPGGADFLSPCLEEADLMWRILPPNEYQAWIRRFLPELFGTTVALSPGTVSDRTDGKLVHLDGLNFSRAWCLYGIARHAGGDNGPLLQLAGEHLQAALPHVASGDYMGEHWLASFAVYALTTQHL